MSKLFNRVCWKSMKHSRQTSLCTGTGSMMCVLMEKSLSRRYGAASLIRMELFKEVPYSLFWLRRIFCNICAFLTEQPPCGKHQCKDISSAWKGFRSWEGSSSEESQAGWELCLPTVQLEGWCGGVLDRYKYIYSFVFSFSLVFHI